MPKLTEHGGENSEGRGPVIMSEHWRPRVPASCGENHVTLIFVGLISCVEDFGETGNLQEDDKLIPID